MLHRPCTYADKNTAKIQRVADSRIPQGKSSLIIFDRHPNLKYKYENRHFWCRGYFVDTVGKNTKKIEEYIKIGHLEMEMYQPLRAANKPSVEPAVLIYFSNGSIMPTVR